MSIARITAVFLLALLLILGWLAFYKTTFLDIDIQTSASSRTKVAAAESSPSSAQKNGLRLAAESPTDGGDTNNGKPRILVLTTKHGSIQITLRPDLSSESVTYIRRLLSPSVSAPCTNCAFYRAENPGILQGILAKPDLVPPNTILGPCPVEFMDAKPHECPPHDPHCGCHGPLMTRGMVAWAAGEGGPDFFIDMYPTPATWWFNEHTVWGAVDETNSLEVVEQILNGKVTVSDGLSYLDEQIHFEISTV